MPRSPSQQPLLYQSSTINRHSRHVLPISDCIHSLVDDVGPERGVFETHLAGGVVQEDVVQPSQQRGQHAQARVLVNLTSQAQTTRGRYHMLSPRRADGQAGHGRHRESGCETTVPGDSSSSGRAGHSHGGRHGAQSCTDASVFSSGFSAAIPSTSLNLCGHRPYR